MKNSINDLLEIIYLQEQKNQISTCSNKTKLQEIFQDNYL